MRPLTTDEFAVTFEPYELKREEEIPQGFVGLLLTKGRYHSLVQPGPLKLQGFWNAFLRGSPSGKRLVLVRSGVVEVSVPTQRLPTKDPHFIDIDSTATIKLQQGAEALFLTNLMVNRRRVTIAEIRDELVYPHLQPAVAGWVQGKLESELALTRADLELTLETALRPKVSPYGLNLIKVECHPLASKVVEEEVRIKTELAEQALAAQRMQVLQKRAEVMEQLRQSFLVEEKSQLTSERDLADLIQSIDKERILREEDHQRFLETLAQEKGDRGKARLHLGKRAEMERDHELKMLTLSKSSQLNEAEQGLERLRMEGQYEIELKRLDMELERRRKESELSLASRQAQEAAQREAAIAAARKDAQVKGIQRDSLRLDEEMRLVLEERRKAQERLHQAEKDRQELARKAEETELEIKREDAALERRIQELKALDQVTLRTLIVVAEPGKAPLLLELAKIEALKGVPLEQFLKESAGNPQGLDSLIESLGRRDASHKEHVLYERIIAAQAKEMEHLRESQAQALNAQKEVAQKAMETVADIAKAYAKRSPEPPAPQEEDTATEDETPHGPPTMWA